MTLSTWIASLRLIAAMAFCALAGGMILGGGVLGGSALAAEGKGTKRGSAKAGGKASKAKTAQAASSSKSKEALLNPPATPSQAPDRYTVKLATAKGDILIDVDRSWCPKGADRFHELVKLGYYDDAAFFRVIQGFMAQLGIHGDPAVSSVWRNRRIDDDPVKQSNTRGMVSFATAGPNTRTTQFFINFADNSRLDGMGFAPFGKVRDMKPVDALHSGYGEGAPQGQGPSQGRLQSEGNAYLKQSFPNLDYVRTATILPQ